MGECNWQEEDRRPEPFAVLALALGVAIATFLAMVS
jgi:hypothetical protein